jgi:hypothetical protein
MRGGNIAGTHLNPFFALLFFVTHILNSPAFAGAPRWLLLQRRQITSDNAGRALNGKCQAAFRAQG